MAKNEICFNFRASSKTGAETQNLFGSESSDSSALEDEEEEEEPVKLPPRKRLRKLSSEEEEDEETVRLKVKLVGLGRGRANVSRVKRRVVTESRLQLLKTSATDKVAQQRMTRAERARLRSQSEKGDDGVCGNDKQSQLSPTKVITSSSKLSVSTVETSSGTSKVVKLAKAVVVKLENVGASGGDAVFKPTLFKRPVKQARTTRSVASVAVKMDEMEEEEESVAMEVNDTETSGPWETQRSASPTELSLKSVESNLPKPKEKTSEPSNAGIKTKVPVMQKSIDSNTGTSDDTEEEDQGGKARFSRFASEKRPSQERMEVHPSKSSETVGRQLKSGSSSLLDNLLSGQVRLLEKGNTTITPSGKVMEGGRPPAVASVPRVRYRGEELAHLQAGCGRLQDYRAPAPGTNVNYRLWNIWDKARPASNLRLLVRCKVRSAGPY